MEFTRRRRVYNAAVPTACFLLLLLLLAAAFLLLPSPPHHSSAATHHVLNGITTHATSSSPSSDGAKKEPAGDCQEMQALEGAEARCSYILSHTPCAAAGYVDYLRLFYCGFGAAPAAVGYAAFLLWLVVLFYLLGDTASEYFCASLEGLSAALRLPPAVAGVTLLSLGNGAPDVFASVVSFAAGDGGDGGGVGLNSALGGALFVSTVVAGVVALAAGSRSEGGGAVVELRGFVRDLCFLFFALCFLVGVLVTGTITVWVAAAFVSLYAAYVVLVWTSQCCADPGKPPHPDLAAPLLLDDDDDVPQLLPSHSAKTTDPAKKSCLHAAVPPAPPHHPGHRGAPLVQALGRGLRRGGPRPRRHDLDLAQPRGRRARPRPRPRHRPRQRRPRPPPRRPRRVHHRRRLPSPRPPAPRAVAGRGVPHERALGLHPGARAGGPARGHRLHGRRGVERAGRHGAGVGGLARRPGLQRGDGHARRARRRADGRVGVLRGPAVQHGGGARAIADAGGGRPVPDALHAPGGRGGVRDGGVPDRRAGVGAGGGAGEGDAAGPGLRGGPHRHLPLLLRHPRPRQPRPLVVARATAAKHTLLLCCSRPAMAATDCVRRSASVTEDD